MLLSHWSRCGTENMHDCVNVLPGFQIHDLDGAKVVVEVHTSLWVDGRVAPPPDCTYTRTG
eukprot:scaffold5221_cov397-Prasinococcus_capsulatus_cf.AAC.10